MLRQSSSIQGQRLLSHGQAQQSHLPELSQHRLLNPQQSPLPGRSLNPRQAQAKVGEPHALSIVEGGRPRRDLNGCEWSGFELTDLELRTARNDFKSTEEKVEAVCAVTGPPMLMMVHGQCPRSRTGNVCNGVEVRQPVFVGKGFGLCRKFECPGCGHSTGAGFTFGHGMTHMSFSNGTLSGIYRHYNPATMDYDEHIIQTEHFREARPFAFPWHANDEILDVKLVFERM